MTSDTIVRDGVLTGPLRASRNTAINVKGSIHDDATASKLGFRGGTVAGSIHMDLFPPLLIDAFGERWIERGNLSLYFRNATVDAELVRGFVRSPESSTPDSQVEVWVEREDGMRVADGTAAVGSPAATSALKGIDVAAREPGELRILANVHPGDVIEEQGVIYSAAQQAERLEVITEKLPWYESGERRGAPVVTPAGMVTLLYQAPSASMRKKIGDAVGLFGAIEVAQVNGPALVDTPYTVRGKVVAVGQSPKTEYFWFDTHMDDRSGRRIAEMRMLLRFMKASSPLYAE
ncbi:MAG: hypothetical protein HYX53_10910 [Chloroflexi bacterium]|nr:hypothetical protein [Chloroflexota bacterium]